MLTLYYVSTTFLQSWRIQKVCNKITEQLAQQTSITFYTLQAGSEDGFDKAFASSELCSNRSAAKVTEILWLYSNQRGCCLRPLQTVHIMSWITFPKEPSWLPFAHENVTPTLSADKRQRVRLLLEANMEPVLGNDSENAEVRLEDYGKLIAWKIDSHLAVLIESDTEHFTKLLITTFLRNNLIINDQLPLLRIESVLYEGTPQPYEELISHLRRSTRNTATLTDQAFKKHLEDLRALSVLARQATEFELNKTRTERKTIKPDLIPQEKKAAAAVVIGTTTTAEINKSSTQQTPKEMVQQVTKKTVTVAEAAKLNEAETNVIKTGMEASSKMKTKPTEIKKPGAAVIESRFSENTKVTKSLPSKILQKESAKTDNASSTSSSKVSTLKASSKTTELEKIAAAAAVSLKQKSPMLVTSPAVTATSTKPTDKISATKAASTIVTAVASQEPINDIVTNSSAISKPNAVANQSTKMPGATTASNGISTATTVSASISASQNNAKRPTLQRNKDSLQQSKPLNILVYSDSASARESTVATLRELLEHDVYTIYAMSPQQAEQKHWLDQTALLVVCGSVAPPIGEILVDYFLHGGKVLSLCSDILHFILPNYRTAEVREHELVQFSYDKWQRVKMMHHIFCYQPSPVKKHFSTDSEESSHSRKSALVCPRSIELKDLTGQTHKLDVQVLGTEETWNTPSLLLANSLQSGGKAVFSQVHLETNPNEFEFDETKYEILQSSEKIRLEIFADLLCKYLDMQVRPINSVALKHTGVVYQQAYFLGRHESKFELLEKLKPNMTSAENTINNTKLTLKFCDKNDKPPQATNDILPIVIHSCPDDFSTVEYFDNLKTMEIGRLVIYAPVVNSSMNVISELELTHGIAVLARQQTAGVGRSNNQWLSPLGCAMFSVQLHIGISSELGKRLPLIQNIIGTAMVNTLHSNDNYRHLDIALKWPNDIYANGINKIGGLVINTTIKGTEAIVNIGCALNLDNVKPTVCVNDLIKDYNRRNQQQLPLLHYEQLVAMVFNEIERLITQVQTGDFDSFYNLYYQLWLHNEQSITICTKKDEKQEAKIIGIDNYGYLRVRLLDGTLESVQPDGNTFDMLKGLIVPKYH